MMLLRDVLAVNHDRLGIWLAADPPGWYAVPEAFDWIPVAHLTAAVVVTRRADAPEGHLWIEELATGYAWRASPRGMRSWSTLTPDPGAASGSYATARLLSGGRWLRQPSHPPRGDDL